MCGDFMSIIKCSFCGKEVESRYNGYCQSCWRYFEYDGYKIFKLPEFGEISYVEEKNDPQYGMVICHICGKAFNKLQQHIYYSHGMSKREYCRMFGIDNKSRLTERCYHKKMSDYAYKYNMPEQLKQCGVSTRFVKGHDNFYERSPMTMNRLKENKFRSKSKKCEVDDNNEK